MQKSIPRLSILILGSIFLTTPSGLCTEELPRLIRSEMVRTQALPQSPTLLTTQISTQDRVPSLNYREIRTDGSQTYALYYPVQNRDLREISAIEIISEPGNRVSQYRHRLLLNGQPRWTDWLPGKLLSQAKSSWNSLLQPLIQIESELSPHLSSKAAQILRTENDLHSLFRQPIHLNANDAFLWKAGTYHWAYQPKSFEFWAGYLWDFKKGLLFRGYRRHRDPKLQEALTPSEDLNQTETASIRTYYDKIPEGHFRSLPKERTITFSPLDKYGLWLERKEGQAWWLPSGWEAAHHFTQYDWGGYCNSSAVLPFLWERPNTTVLDQNIWFDPRDLVGIMQAASYDVDYLFWGKRFNGDPGDDISEPSPEFAIELIREYLGKNQIPIVFDHEAGGSVGNMVLLWASLIIEPTPNPQNLRATLELHSVGNLEDEQAHAFDDEWSPVPPWNHSTTTKNYSFEILLNTDGSLQSTHWTDPTKHPDFFWLPTGLKKGEPPYSQNPYLDVTAIQGLVKKSNREAKYPRP